MLAFLKRCYTDSNIKPMTFVYKWKKHSLGSRRRDWAQRVPDGGAPTNPSQPLGGLGAGKERPPPGVGDPRPAPALTHRPAPPAA